MLRACVLNFERLDIWQQSIEHPSENYCRLNLLQTSIFNLEHLNILRDLVGHPSKKLLSFEIAQNFCSQFRASRYITGLNRTSELKVIVVGICYERSFSNSSVLIYYRTQSDIRAKICCRLNCLRAYVFNLERLDILRDSFEHPCIKLLSIYYGTQPDIWEKSYYRLNLVWASVFKLEHLDILRDSIGLPCIKLLSLEFATSFHFQFLATRYITGLNRTSVYKVIVNSIFSELRI